MQSGVSQVAEAVGWGSFDLQLSAAGARGAEDTQLRTYPTNNICAKKLKLIENGKQKIKVFKHILRKEVGIFRIVG